MSLPTVLPVLKPDDFIVGPLGDDEGRYCLVGWKEKLVEGDVIIDGVGSAHISLLDECCQAEGTPNILYWSATNSLRNRQHSARIWADFISRLGFTDDGPEMDLEA